MLAISREYEDANDLDTLRHDPGFKLVLGVGEDMALAPFYFGRVKAENPATLDFSTAFDGKMSMQYLVGVG